MAAKYLPSGIGLLASTKPFEFIDANASIDFAKSLLKDGGAPSANDLDQYHLIYEEFAVEIATELGVVFGDFSGSSMRKFIVYEYMRCKDVPGPNNAVVRWGSSARCIINIKRMEAEASISGIANITMNAQMNKVEANVLIDGIGMKPSPLSDALPKFNKLDMSTYVKLEHAFLDALPELMKTSEYLSPTLLGVWGESSDPGDDKVSYRDALAKSYVLSEISKRVALQQSSYFNSANAESSFKDAATAYFKEFTRFDSIDKKPTKGMADKAANLLKGLETETLD